LSPHEQKKKNSWINAKQKCLKQNFNKGLRPALALLVVSRIISLRLVLSQRLPSY
jgi:hypothetical protein